MIRQYTTRVSGGSCPVPLAFLLMLLLLLLLLPVAARAQEGGGAAPPNNQCPVYKEESRTTVVSSTRGQLFDSGWITGPTFASCDPKYREVPNPPPSCQSIVLPGPSLGQNDVMITICKAKRYTCVANCACVASPLTTKIAVKFPNIEFLTSKLSAVAKGAPMIKKMTFTLGGQVTLKKGEECCQPPPALAPAKYSEYGGSAKLGLGVELQVPGWGYSFEHTWEGIYKVSAEISLGPTVSVEPSVTASVAGKVFDNQVCPGCLTTGIALAVGVGVKFGGTVKGTIEMYRPWTWSFSTGVNASAELSSSINGGGEYAVGAGCKKAGLSGTIGYGKLDGTATVGASFMGYGFSYSWGITLLPGASFKF